MHNEILDWGSVGEISCASTLNAFGWEMRAEEVRNTGAYASGKQIALLIGSGDVCQPLSSRNKKGNVPGQRVGWNLYTLAEPDPRVRLCVPAVFLIVLCLPPRYP